MEKVFLKKFIRGAALGFCVGFVAGAIGVLYWIWKLRNLPNPLTFELFELKFCFFAGLAGLALSIIWDIGKYAFRRIRKTRPA